MFITDSLSFSTDAREKFTESVNLDSCLITCSATSYATGLLALEQPEPIIVTTVSQTNEERAFPGNDIVVWMVKNGTV